MKKVFKKLYDAAPLKQPAFRVLRAFHPPRSVYQHLHFKGIMRVQVDDRAFRLRHYGSEPENSFFWTGLFGSWEKESLRLWCKLALNSKVILDVGANHGIYSLIAKCVNADSQVFAFEPVKSLYDQLVENCNINRYSVVCENSAVGDRNGTATIYAEPGITNGSGSLNPAFEDIGRTGEAMSVPIVTLDSYLSNAGIDTVDLVKIDVESFEPQVLQGFQKTIARCKPAMLIEVLTDDAGRQIESLIGSQEYLFFDIHERNGITRVPHMNKGSGRNYLVCRAEIAKAVGLTVD